MTTTDRLDEHLRHLRLVHFVLVVLCSIVLLFSLDAKPQQYDEAISELEALENKSRYVSMRLASPNQRGMCYLETVKTNCLMFA